MSLLIHLVYSSQILNFVVCQVKPKFSQILTNISSAFLGYLMVSFLDHFKVEPTTIEGCSLFALRNLFEGI